MKYPFEYIKSVDDELFDDEHLKWLLFTSLENEIHSQKSSWEAHQLAIYLLENFDSISTRKIGNENESISRNHRDEKTIKRFDEIGSQYIGSAGFIARLKKRFWHLGLRNVSVFVFDNDKLVTANVANDYNKENIDYNRYELIERAYSIGSASVVLHFVVLRHNMWPQNHTLKVYFMTKNEHLANIILTTAQEWSEHCNIKFERTLVYHRSHIRVSFAREGHWSVIGTLAQTKKRKRPSMNFDVKSVDIGSEYFKGIIRHEFGHALGLLHEHQSSNVPMDWDKETVYREFKKEYGWSTEKVDENLFERYEFETKKASREDPLSIMTYPIEESFTFSKKTFQRNNTLSQTDIEYIGQLYPKR